MIETGPRLIHQNNWLKKISNLFLVYSPFFTKMRDYKDYLFQPISQFCVRSNIPPWFLSLIGLFFGLLSLTLFFIGYWYFVILMSVSLIFDFVDGSVARYSSQVSNFGKYLDFVIDHILMILMVFSLCNYINNYYWLIGAGFFSLALYINIITYCPVHIPSGRITLFVPCLFGAPQVGLLLLTLYGFILTAIMLLEQKY